MSAPEEPTVHGYGDANADFHVIGIDADTHGGAETGVPFTGSIAGERIQSVLHSVGFAAEPYSDTPRLENCYLSYLWLSPGDPDDLERYIDAELRALNAHILLPVGDEALSFVLSEFTTKAGRIDPDSARLHASEIRGRGFLVIPIKEPADWDDEDETALVDRLTELLESDYRQTKGIPTTVG